jgi:hypothetical protein
VPGVSVICNLSPSWEAASCAAARELPSILWNQKIYYHVHKSHPLVPILSQINPVHTTPSYLFKIHLNIIHPPTPWSSGIPTNNLCAFLFSPICARLSHLPPLDDSNYTWWRVQVMKLLIMQFSPASHNSVPLWPKCSPQHPVLEHPQSMFLPRQRLSFAPIQNHRQSNLRTVYKLKQTLYHFIEFQYFFMYYNV